MSNKKHEVPEKLLSGLEANYDKPEDLISENGLLKQLTKLMVERALDAELTEHRQRIETENRVIGVGIKVAGAGPP